MSDPRRPSHSSGKLLVIILVVGGLIAALVALKYRVYEPRQPASRPTTLP